MEVEAKFSIPDRATFDRLRQLGELAGYRLKPAGVKQFEDRYLDTSDRAIYRAGYACRVRRKGPSLKRVEGRGPGPGEGETFVATLKGLGGADVDSGIHQREEYETPADDVDPTTWPASAARDLALKLSSGQPLRELFTLSQERHFRLLVDDVPECARQIAELTLDVVTPGGHSPRPYYELEIELLAQGTETELQDLAAVFRTTWGLRPEPRSKFERGLTVIEEAVGGKR